MPEIMQQTRKCIIIPRIPSLCSLNTLGIFPLYLLRQIQAIYSIALI